MLTITLTCTGCRRPVDTLYDGRCGWCLAAAGRNPDGTGCRITVVPTAPREADR